MSRLSFPLLFLFSSSSSIFNSWCSWRSSYSSLYNRHKPEYTRHDQGYNRHITIIMFHVSKIFGHFFPCVRQAWIGSSVSWSRLQKSSFDWWQTGGKLAKLMMTRAELTMMVVGWIIGLSKNNRVDPRVRAGGELVLLLPGPEWTTRLSSASSSADQSHNGVELTMVPCYQSSLSQLTISTDHLNWLFAPLEWPAISQINTNIHKIVNLHHNKKSIDHFAIVSGDIESYVGII